MLLKVVIYHYTNYIYLQHKFPVFFEHHLNLWGQLEQGWPTMKGFSSNFTLETYYQSFEHTFFCNDTGKLMMLISCYLSLFAECDVGHNNYGICNIFSTVLHDQMCRLSAEVYSSTQIIEDPIVTVNSNTCVVPLLYFVSKCNVRLSLMSITCRSFFLFIVNVGSLI